MPSVVRSDARMAVLARVLELRAGVPVVEEAVATFEVSAFFPDASEAVPDAELPDLLEGPSTPQAPSIRPISAIPSRFFIADRYVSFM